MLIHTPSRLAVALGLASSVILADTATGDFTASIEPDWVQQNTVIDYPTSASGVFPSSSHGNTRGRPTKRSEDDRDSYVWKHKCPQVEALAPETNERLRAMEQYLASSRFHEESALRMSKAIQVDTTVTDEMRRIEAVGHAWNSMTRFARFLKSQFPLVHRRFKLERVNTHGLVFTWQGTNATLKPTILMAHQDVVAVDPQDFDSWTHPPFEGNWDGKYIWGRGATDCKNTLIAFFEATEELARARFEPQRTIILSLGFDEEIDGRQGAEKIVDHLLTTYGEDGIAAIVDEGPGIIRSWGGSLAAFVGVAEKGFMDVEIDVQMGTGHSSLPPLDNSITVMADILHELHGHQYNVSVGPDNPAMEPIFCAAQHDKSLIYKAWNLVARMDKGELSFNKLADTMIAFKPKMAGFFGTTQSIIPGSSTEDVKAHVEQIVKAYAESHKPNRKEIVVNAWNDQVESPDKQTITLKVRGNVIEPSRISPFSVKAVSPFGIIEGTTFAQYGPDLVFVAPTLMPANTDSRHFSKLSRHIFRFNPSKDIDDDTDEISGLHGPHSIDERLNMVGHVHAVQWYSLLLRNMDDATFVDES